VEWLFLVPLGGLAAIYFIAARRFYSAYFEHYGGAEERRRRRRLLWQWPDMFNYLEVWRTPWGPQTLFRRLDDPAVDRLRRDCRNLLLAYLVVFVAAFFGFGIVARLIAQ
jgi:hypothetical protein